MRKRSGLTVGELLVIILIIVVLVGLLYPAVQAARNAARRMNIPKEVGEQQSISRFKTIGSGEFPDEPPFFKQPYCIVEDTKTGHKYIYFRSGGTNCFTRIEDNDAFAEVNQK